MAESFEFQTGEFLVEQGQHCPMAFIIESGSVKIVASEGGQEHVLGIAESQQIVNEMALFEEAPAAASVVAIEPTRARPITRDRLLSIMEKEPAACLPFIKAIMDRLRESHVMLLASRTTPELIKTTRVRLTLEPVSDEAKRICAGKTVLEMDIVPHEGAARFLAHDLEKHFNFSVEAILPDMQR